jgi:MraZ protein
MLLTGTFVRAIDEKQRIAIPKRLRDALGASAAAGLYVTPGTDGSLAIYTEDVLTSLGGRLSAASPTQQEVRTFSRLFYAQAERVEMDSQSRIRLPPQLVTLAGISTEAVLLGVQDHMELWDRQRWETYFGEKSARYDEIAEGAFGSRSDEK